jgi:hypothetical protein
MVGGVPSSTRSSPSLKASPRELAG